MATVDFKLRKTTLTIPEPIMDGLQHYIARTSGMTFRDQSKVIVTALAEFLINRDIDPEEIMHLDRDNDRLMKYIFISELSMPKYTDRSEE